MGWKLRFGQNCKPPAVRTHPLTQLSLVMLSVWHTHISSLVKIDEQETLSIVVRTIFEMVTSDDVDDLFPHQGWIAARASNRVNSSLWTTKWK